MSESIKEESVGFLFNIEVQVEPAPQPQVEPVHVADMLAGLVGATGGNGAAALAGAPTGGGMPGAPAGAPAPAPQPAGVAQDAGRGPLGEPALRPGSPLVRAKGLETPRRASQLHYSAPGETGGVEERDDGLRTSRRELSTEQIKTAKRNEPCPCGSGKKYKMCHGRGKA
jgi:preprotein translocase subunit SecA